MVRTSLRWIVASSLFSFAFAFVPTVEAQRDQEQREQREDDQSFRDQGRNIFRRLRGSDNTRDSEAMLQSFREITETPSGSTAQILKGREQLALATVVSEDGFLVTKWSELKPGFRCRLPNGEEVAPAIVGIDIEEDIALLKVEDANLVPVTFVEDSAPVVGHWLVSVGTSALPMGVGVVSVAARPIRRGFMGVLLDDYGDNEGAIITRLVEGAPAAASGFEVDDVIIKVKDMDVANRPACQLAIGKCYAGEDVSVIVLRDGEEMELNLVLGYRSEIDQPSARSNQQNELGGPLNDVREGFRLAIQHDSGIDANQCGGPVVGIDGSVVGINIARAGRVKSYATAASILVPLIERLKTAEFSLAEINSDEIARVDGEIEEYENRIQTRVTEPLAEVEADYARIDEAIAAIEAEREAGEIEAEDAEEQIAELEAERIEAQKLERVARSRERRYNARLESLREERRWLSGEEL